MLLSFLDIIMLGPAEIVHTYLVTYHYKNDPLVTIGEPIRVYHILDARDEIVRTKLNDWLHRNKGENASALKYNLIHISKYEKL